MILLIDNYDSFSYNLVQLIGGIQKERFEKSDDKKKVDGPECNYGIKVIRNDEMTVPEIEALNPDYIILSPGPGRPKDAGVCEDFVKSYKGNGKILGVCLGHQAIFESFDGTVTYAKQLMHGKTSEITFDSEEPIFHGIPQNIKIARYHSLAGDANTIPECLKVIAQTADGEIMAVKHKERNVYGFQFHPESVLTEYGKKMLENFLQLSNS